MNSEIKRKKNWKKWGPYLSERQWGTVREDYSPEGEAWDYFPFEHALIRAYRWGEDGIGGISDDKQILCFAPAFWNGKDKIIKERLYGLTNKQGNHGEDVKEYYYYLDNTPTHSYMKMLYKYPHKNYPYMRLLLENNTGRKDIPEFELIDTGIFNDNNYFDIFIEYSKNNTEDILIKLTIFNRGKNNAALNMIPQIWFRNTWAWGKENYIPRITKGDLNYLKITHKEFGNYYLYFENFPETLFCNNDTNLKTLYDEKSDLRFFKDGINNYIVNGKKDAVDISGSGTKAGLNYKLDVSPNNPVTLRFRLVNKENKNPFEDFDEIFKDRKNEADNFYNEIQSDIKDKEVKNIQRQAFAGMLWNKQFYYYDIREWLNGDSAQPPPPPERKSGRNSDWFHLNNSDIISMPDKWEYPWYATWDSAFHSIPLSLIDPEFAKDQLLLFTNEWYMHPNGQLPAYEWNFSDVNPPVHAWAAWRVFKIDQKHTGKSDYRFLEKIFHKLLINFTWWINKKDVDGRNIFQGGFLGMDNIGVFDRSEGFSDDDRLDQADGTSWMAMYCLNLMRIALELSKMNSNYQNLASKFFEHFLYIAGAMTNIGREGIGLWDEKDQFYYDVLHSRTKDKSRMIKVRSMVGLIPLFAVEVIDPDTIEHAPEFTRRLKWFLKNRPDLAKLVSRWYEHGEGETTLLSLLRGSRMKKLLKRMLDESEYLSDYGVRSLSKIYKENTYELKINNHKLSIKYAPAESDTYMFGGNSNWRGPIWFPVNYLIIESLQKFHHYYGEEFKIEYPTGSGSFMTIKDVADELSNRLKKIFIKDSNGNRAFNGNNKKFNTDPHFKDYILFYEYFHAETGKGLGASHQTGWTGLIAKLFQPRTDD